MFRLPWRLAAVSTFALLLTACQVTVAPPTFDPPIAATVTAPDTTNPPALRSGVTIQPGTTLYFRVNVPDARDLLYGEVVGASGLRVAWLTSTGTTLAVSESPAYFAGSVNDLAIAADAEASAFVEPLIIVNFSCNGPCAAIAPTAPTYYLAVHNTTSSPRTFDLFAYTFSANDLNDRGVADNQTAANATMITSDDESGAIELVGDRDWYRYPGPAGRRLTFSANDPALGLRLRFQDNTTLASGQSTILQAGDVFEVYSAVGLAGPSSTSGYTIQIRNP
jgi:hypothetical protein